MMKNFSFFGALFEVLVEKGRAELSVVNLHFVKGGNLVEGVYEL